MKTRLAAMLFAFALPALAGCGNKGPLVLPAEPVLTEVPAAGTDTTPAEPVPADATPAEPAPADPTPASDAVAPPSAEPADAAPPADAAADSDAGNG